MDFVRQLINAKLLASNFVLVATHVSQGRRAKAERQQIGLPLDAMLHEAASKLGLAFGVHEHLTCFDIDTAPVRLPQILSSFCCA